MLNRSTAPASGTNNHRALHGDQGTQDMKVYDDGWVQQYQGDALDVLPTLPAESVQSCICSPPYWGLRLFEGDQSRVWGGDPECEHTWSLGWKYLGRHEHLWASESPEENRPIAKNVKVMPGQTCLKCEAWKGPWGLEPTIQMYVDHTLEFLRCIRRVLRPDGVILWNVGDSYAGTQGGLPPKDLCLIPERVAIAAQNDGWRVRADIIWNRVNCMPQSAEDRPTISHQYIWLLTKNPIYYWDKEAVKEPQTGNAHSRGRELGDADYQEAKGAYIGFHHSTETDLGGRNIRSVWEFTTEAFGQQMCLSCGVIFEGRQYRRFPLRDRGDGSKGRVCPCGASDWLSHFAVFPRELPRRCILATTSEKGNCSKCGKPWVRTTKPSEKYSQVLGSGQGYHNHVDDLAMGMKGTRGDNKQNKMRDAGIYAAEYETTGWKPQCECGAPAEPATVIDICSGTGTTGVEAKSLGRKAILIDISGKYCRLAIRRLEAVPLPLVGVA